MIARPAKYGPGEETILDTRVRDTWEVPRSRVRIQQRRWRRTLDPVLEQIREDLGLPTACTLCAQLHSMLVYEPGQFFAGHQDSEKDDRMIATLVVMLPSRSTGGALVVEHRGDPVRYSGSAKALTCVAFYSDTRHEVLPVETGYRVVLTYNVLLSGDVTGVGVADEAIVDTAAQLLRRHFTEKPPSRWADDAQYAPDRLVLLLDHQYTGRGLRWSHLTGEDAARADVLARAAALADCRVALAKAEVHETRDSHDEGAFGYYDYDDPPADSDPVFGDLLDCEVTITPAAGETARLQSAVGAHELAEVTPSEDLQPYESEHTGFMGNWGNTMDRWYRRAALVVWPQSRAFAVLAQADPVGAIGELLADDPARPERDEDVTALLRFWATGVRLGDQRSFLPPALRLAARLDDPALSQRLLEPFTLEALSPGDAPALVDLATRRGIRWLRTTISGRASARSATYGPTTKRPEWVASLPELCRGLCGAGGGRPLRGEAIARTITGHTVDWLEYAIGQAAASASPSRRRQALADLAQPTLSVLRSTAVVEDTPLRDPVVAAVCATSGDLPAVEVVRSASGWSAGEAAALGLDVITAHARDEVTARLAHPPREADDWSIPGFDATCCDDCATLSGFLSDPVATRLPWPLAKGRREHIHQRIEEAELPLTHTTTRKGSPYTLVIAKTPALHSRDVEERRAAQESLDMLRLYLDRADGP